MQPDKYKDNTPANSKEIHKKKQHRMKSQPVIKQIYLLKIIVKPYLFEKAHQP
ncbi:MAG: hypothetical protein ACRCTK_03610 [Alphaproteobacteria bacterium]